MNQIKELHNEVFSKLKQINIPDFPFKGLKLIKNEYDENNIFYFFETSTGTRITKYTEDYLKKNYYLNKIIKISKLESIITHEKYSHLLNIDNNNIYISYDIYENSLRLLFCKKIRSEITVLYKLISNIKFKLDSNNKIILFLLDENYKEDDNLLDLILKENIIYSIFELKRLFNELFNIECYYIENSNLR